MKTLTVFLTIVVLLTLTSCGKEEVEVTREVEVTPAFDAEAEEEKLEAVSAALNEAFADGDTATLRDLVHPDWLGYFTGSDDQYTLNSSVFFGDVPAQIHIVEDSDWTITPDLAFRRSFWTVYLKSEGPSDLDERNYLTTVFKKEDGQWRLIQSHASYTP